MDVGAIGKKGDGKKGDGKKGDGKKVEAKKAEDKVGKNHGNNGAVNGKGQGTQKFEGNCNYRKKYGHMARDCRKKKADDAQKQRHVGAVDQSTVQSTSSTASVGAVALVSSTPSGAGIGRLVMAISDQGERFDAYQVFDGSRHEVVVMMVIDSGSEVHTAPVTFPWNMERFDKTSICLSDVQGNKLKVYGTALLNYEVHDNNGNVVEIGTRFLVSDTVNFVLSVGELGRHGWSSTLGSTPCLLHEAGCRVPLSRKSNTIYLSARLGFLGEAPWKMVATTSTGSAVPLPSGRELGSPVSLNVVPEGSSVHEAEILDAPRKPEDPMEIERHEVTHIPPMPWCLACRMGKGRDASLFRSPAEREAAQIQVDFCFLREEAAAYDATESVPENPWAMILCAVDVSTQNPLAVALPGKNAELEYAIGQLFGFVKRLGYTDLVIRSDGEPAITAIVDRLMAEIKKTGVQARVPAERFPRCSSQSSGAVGSMQAQLQKEVRTLKTDLGTKIKSHLLTSMAVWPWLVRHSAWLDERYRMRADGRTSYQDCFGTAYTGIVLRFGEQAVFLHPVGTAAGRNRRAFKQLRKEKAANKMDLGMWLGKTYESDEHYMGTSDGTFTARTCNECSPMASGRWRHYKL